MAIETIDAKAKTCFTRYIADHGIVHGDPDGKADAKTVKVPVTHIDAWIAEELVEKPKGYTAPVAEEAATEAEPAAEEKAP